MRCEFCGVTTGKEGSDTCCTQLNKGTPNVLSSRNVAIFSVEDWLHVCPPKGGARQWRDNYSAKECAKSWFREGALCVPRELATLFDSHQALGGFRLGTVRPELRTRLDGFRQGRNADAVITGVANGGRTVISVEAKASEDFGPQIESRLNAAISSTKVPNRINALSEAVFGRRAITVDPALGGLRYQLLHAFVGTLIEALARRADQAAMVVHYFPNKRREMDETWEDFVRFIAAVDSTSTRIEPGSLVRVQLKGSADVPADLPLFVGWAIAPKDH